MGTARRLRRTAIGPFDVSEAAAVDEAQLMSAGDALARLPEPARERVEAEIRAAVLAVEEDA